MPPQPGAIADTGFSVGYDGVDQPLWRTSGLEISYFELDATGNVRHLHAIRSASATFKGDLGGYGYTAFGKSIAPSDPGGVTPPVGINASPFPWQGKRFMAPNLYDSRARVWSADWGAFLQPDEYGYLTPTGTL